MQKGTKIILALLGTGAVVGTGIYVVGKLKKVSKLTQNLFVDAKPSGISRKGASVNVHFDVELTNYSGFDLKIKNLYCKIQYKSKNSPTWTDAGQSNIFNTLAFKTNQTAPKFTLKLALSAFTTLIQLMNGGISEIQLVTYYDFAGQQMSEVKGLDVAAIIKAVKSQIGLSGLNEATSKILKGGTIIPLMQNANGIYSMI